MKKDNEEGNNFQFTLFPSFSLLLYRIRTHPRYSHHPQKVPRGRQKLTKQPKPQTPRPTDLQGEDDWLYHQHFEQMSTGAQG